MENCLVMQDHLPCEDEEKQDEVEVEEELIESKVSFFDALQALEAARKYIQQFDVEDDILATCSKLENKLFALNYQEKCKQITILDWLRNEIYSVLILQMIFILNS
jgi:5'-deoxynucleotidase YfbR-like HD superfamily hydrolase